MTLEEYLPYAIALLALFIILRYTSAMYGARQKALARTQAAAAAKGDSIADKLPDSAYDLLKQMEVGLEKFGDDMTQALHAKGIADPMSDAGYAHLVGRLDQVRKWRVAYESNPLLQLADSIGWPILKRMPDSVIGYVEGLVG